MGGGHSAPKSSQHNGVDIHTTTGAHSINTYSNIHSDGGNTNQHATASGAKVKVGVTANIVPALMNLEANTVMYMVKDDACLEFQIQDSLVSAAKAHGLISGSCGYNGWINYDSSFTQNVKVGAHVLNLPVTQWSHAGLMNLCDGSNCNKMGMVVLLI